MSITDIPVSWLPIADAVLKATVVLAGAAAASFALRHKSAALRHLVWTLALASVLVLPILSLAVPRYQLPLVTVTATAGDDAELVTGPAGGPQMMEAPPADRGPVAPPRPGKSADASAPTVFTGGNRIWPSSISWQQALLAIWAAGMLLIIGRMLAGLLVVQWLSRRTERVLDAPWMQMACSLAGELGIPNVRFLRSGRATMPVAWGIMTPAVMMPADADQWPVARLRLVLLHELAHVKRRDSLTHLVAQMACALYWFNPLTWVAARHVRTERERACDDLVLAFGTRGSDYADQLIEIARVMRAGRFPGVMAGASLAMAHQSQLEGRLIAILDPKVPRSGLSALRAAAVTLLCACAVVPLAAVQPWTTGEQRIENSVGASAAVVPPDAGTQTPSPSPSPSPSPNPSPSPSPSPSAGRAVGPPREQSLEQTIQSAAQGAAQGASQAAAQGATQGAVQGATQGAVQAATQGAIQGATQGAIQGAFGAVGAAEWRARKNDKDAAAQKADPRTIAALTAALKDSDKDVRETAMHALVQMRDPSIFEPLVQALKDSAPDVREQAAFGLGQLRDRRAVDPLIAALNDENADVREQAAFALGQLRDPKAASALAAALKDKNPDVREQAVFALGQMRDPASFDGLVIALKDENADVREQAAFALGQLRDRRGVEPLISALKDANGDVKEQAAFALGQIRDRSAVEALIFALKDGNADVREQAAFALGQIRDPRAIDGLTAALKDPSADVRQQAAFALGQLAR